MSLKKQVFKVGKEAVLTFIEKQNNIVCVQDIQNETDIPYKFLNKIVDELEGEAAIKVKRVGRAKFILPKSS